MPSLFTGLLFALMVGVLGPPSIATAQSKSNTDPLKAFTKCSSQADLKVKEVTRRPKSTEKHRYVLTASGKAKVSVIDGYRVMFGYRDLPYYFANVKLEQSEPSSYAQDKEKVVSELKYLSSTKQATGNIFSDKTMLNGFEHYGLDRDTLDVGLTVGTHLLLYDPGHLVITVYFLNQDDRRGAGSTAGNVRRFKNLDEYHQLKDDFLNRYSECLQKIAETRVKSFQP